MVPRDRLLALIVPHYPKSGLKGGRPAMPLEIVAGPEIDPGDRFPGDWLRVYFLQNWDSLSDPMAEETLYDSGAMRRALDQDGSDQQSEAANHDDSGQIKTGKPEPAAHQ